MQTPLEPPPHNAEIEDAVIMALFADPDTTITTCRERLAAGDFYQSAHGWIWQAAVKLHDAGTPITLLSVAESLKTAGRDVDRFMDVLERAENGLPDAWGCKHFADVVREKAMRRDVLRIGYEMAQAVRDRTTETTEILGRFISQLERVDATDAGNTTVTAPEMGPRLAEYYRKRVESFKAGRPPGLPTGLPTLDYMLNGLKGGELVIIGGRPGHGKSVLGMQIAVNVALTAHTRKQPEGKTGGVHFVSLEMSAESLLERAVCSRASVDMRLVQSGKLDEGVWQDKIRQSGVMDSPLFMRDDAGIPVANICGKARALYARHGIELVVVDYLGLVQPDERQERRDLDIGQITGALKALAMDLNIPVILLAQLNRAIEGRQKFRPVLSDLRESGNIEQDADIVMFVCRDEMREERTAPRTIERSTVILAKNRSGPIGDVKCVFRGPFVRIEEMTDAFKAEIDTELKTIASRQAAQQFKGGDL